MASVENFLSELPPEVVLKITDYLEVPDVLRCMRVCKAWQEILSVGEMTPFWRRACVHIGLPQYYVKEHMTSPKFPSELFHEIRLHRDKVAALSPEIHSIGGIHPFESTQKCEYAGGGFFVKTIDYCSLEYEETVIGEFSPDKRTIVKRDSYKSNCGQVMWARLLAGNILYQTYGPKWFRYEIESQRFIQLTPGKMERGINNTIGHCRHCLFMMLASTENSMYGYSWLFHFLNFSNGRDNDPLEAKHKAPIPHGITQFIPRPVRAHLLPENGSCANRHLLIIQGGTGACVFRITHNEEEGIKVSPKPIGTLNPFFDIDIAVMVVNTTSGMTLSLDEEVIGIITCVVYPFQSGLCLHVFDTQSFERISSVKVDWKEGFNDGEVLACSRLYAALAVGHSKGIVKLVHARTGQVLRNVVGLSRGLPPIVPMSRLLLVHYEGMFGEECLVDIHSPFTLVVLYRKGVNNMEGVWFAPYPVLDDNKYIVELSEESEDDRED